MGRNTKCTDDVIKKVAEALSAGNFFNVACEYAGVAESTGHDWLKRGENAGSKKSEEPFKKFWEAVQQASTRTEVLAVAHWRKAFPEDWRAVESFLKRRFPKRWGDKASLEHTGADGGPIQTLDLSQLTDEQFKFLQDNAALLEALFGSPANSSGSAGGKGSAKP